MDSFEQAAKAKAQSVEAQETPKGLYSARTGRAVDYTTAQPLSAPTSASTPKESSRYPTQRYNVQGGVDASGASPAGFQMSSVLVEDTQDKTRKAYAVGDTLPDGSNIQDIQRLGMGEMAVSVVLPDGREAWLGRKPSPAPPTGPAGSDALSDLSEEDLALVDEEEARYENEPAVSAKQQAEREVLSAARVQGLRALREAGFAEKVTASAPAYNPAGGGRIQFMLPLSDGSRQQVFYEYPTGKPEEGVIVEGELFPAVR